MAWICPVCGQLGKRTQEHVFGKWLSDLLGVRKRPITMFSSREGKKWSSLGLGTIVNICEACNGGWMSDLEGAFGSAFSQAILGHPATFQARELTTLAHWATKTALMLQPHLAGMREVTHSPNGHLAALPLGIPAGSRVWLGAYTPITRYVFWQQAPLSLPNRPPTSDAGWTGYVMLMTVGHMMLVVLGLDAEYGDDFTVAGLPDVVFRPIWPLPAMPVLWPDGLILNDKGIATIWPPKAGELIVYGPEQP